MSLRAGALGKYIGIPFVHKGRDLNGLDCWGLIKLIYADRGYELRDLDEYELEAHLKGQDCFHPYECGEWAKHDQPRPFDLVLILNEAGVAYHAGLYLAEDKFIHCFKKTGVVIMNFKAIQSRMRTEGFWRLKAAHDNDTL